MYSGRNRRTHRHDLLDAEGNYIKRPPYPEAELNFYAATGAPMASKSMDLRTVDISGSLSKPFSTVYPNPLLLFRYRSPQDPKRDAALQIGRCGQKLLAHAGSRLLICVWHRVR